jgi:asparagine synthase (glutamine-hydrolysing)
MSGIYGALGPSGHGRMAAMGHRLLHRGRRREVAEPEASVRLACLYGDGPPPLAERGACAAVADAELTNAAALRALLEKAGTPPPETDAGLLAALYERFGAEGLDHANGVFALALWDAARRELVLARDLIGCQPLYCVRPQGQGLIFASEIKALLACEEVEARPDRAMVQYLQNWKHLPATRTLLQGIEAVPPGTVVAFDAQGEVAWKKALAMPPLAVEAALSADAAEAAIRRTFLKSVEARIAGRASIGVALSGGIDSIGLACACRELRPELAIHTFTAGAGPEDPEIQKAGFVAGKIGAHHHEVILEPARLPALLPSLVWHLETPIARSETAQFFEIGRAAAAHVDTVLTGAASDGLFAGMPRHKILWLMGMLPPARTALGEFYALTQSARRPATLGGRLVDWLYYRGGVPPAPAVQGAGDQSSLPAFGPYGPELINQTLHAGFQEGVARWLPKIERSLAASGLRHHSPFLDKELIALAFTIPSALKIRRGKEKFVLRRALRSIVPPEVLNVPKFPMRMSHEGAFQDVLRGMAATVLAKERVERRGFFDPAEIKRLVEARGGFEGTMRLWTALLSELWAELFLDGRGRSPAAAQATPARMAAPAA